MEKYEQIVITKNKWTWQPGRAAIANGLDNNVGELWHAQLMYEWEIKVLTFKFRTDYLGVDFGKNNIFNLKMFF